MSRTLQPRDLLLALASGEPVSGQELAARFGVTRAAVWKHMRTLRDLGVPMTARSRYGYALPWPVQLLRPARIRRLLPADAGGPLEVCWMPDSTSSELARQQQHLGDLAVVLAEGQSAGRGRRGRNWLSPPGLNLYLSCLKHFSGGFAGLSGLSLAVGVWIVQALSDLGATGLTLKWPNDVVVGKAKLAGVLVELGGEYQGPCTAIIGIGVNLRMGAAMRKAVGRPVVDLAELCAGPVPDRNVVAARMITSLRHGLRRFERDGFAPFAADFERLDALRGRRVRASGALGAVDGVVAGIDPRGALRITTAKGEVQVNSAEVSVRAQ